MYILNYTYILNYVNILNYIYILNYMYIFFLPSMRSIQIITMQIKLNMKL